MTRDQIYRSMAVAISLMDHATKEMKRLDEEALPAQQVPLPHTPRDFRGDDVAISELRGLTKAGKEFLCHHIRNSLNNANLCIEAGYYRDAQASIWQLNDVLQQIMGSQCTCTCDYSSEFGANRCAYHENLDKEGGHGIDADSSAGDTPALHPVADR